MTGASVRTVVAQRTRAAHEALHEHAQIRQLIEPSLSQGQYVSVLSGFHAVYRAAEYRRKHSTFWLQFNLAEHCAALRSDIGSNASVETARLPDVDGAPGILGLLYALHGAQFGSSVILRNVRHVLPTAPCRYFSMGTRPRIWRELVAAMEDYRGAPGAVDHIVSGARSAFSALDAACALKTNQGTGALSA